MKPRQKEAHFSLHFCRISMFLVHLSTCRILCRLLRNLLFIYFCRWYFMCKKRFKWFLLVSWTYPPLIPNMFLFKSFDYTPNPKSAIFSWIMSGLRLAYYIVVQWDKQNSDFRGALHGVWTIIYSFFTRGRDIHQSTFMYYTRLPVGGSCLWSIITASSHLCLEYSTLQLVLWTKKAYIEKKKSHCLTYTWVWEQ